MTFPETMDTTASKLVSEVDGDTLYVAFNGIQNRSTDYFVAGSDSLSITGYATTESTNENFQTFKIALWALIPTPIRFSLSRSCKAAFSS